MNQEPELDENIRESINKAILRIADCFKFDETEGVAKTWARFAELARKELKTVLPDDQFKINCDRANSRWNDLLPILFVKPNKNEPVFFRLDLRISNDPKALPPDYPHDSTDVLN